MYSWCGLSGGWVQFAQRHSLPGAMWYMWRRDLTMEDKELMNVQLTMKAGAFKHAKVLALPGVLAVGKAERDWVSDELHVLLHYDGDEDQVKDWIKGKGRAKGREGEV